MITLYHAPRSRSTRIIFLLEELGAPYAIKQVSIRRSDGSGSTDPINPHPHGKVPVIDDDGVVVFESPAIALHLTDKFPNNGIGPQVDDNLRGAYLSWLIYYASVLEPAFMSKFMKIEVPRGSAGWVPVEEAMDAVTQRLEVGPYMLGDGFSAADILYGTTFAMFRNSPLLNPSPVLDAYIERIISRPAYQRAMALDDGS